MNAKEVIVQNFSVIDSNGKKRVSICEATAIPRVMSFFDEKDIPRVTLDLLNTEPILKLAGNKGSVSIEFDEEGLPNLMLKDNMDKNIWSAR